MQKSKNKYYAGDIKFNTLDERDEYYQKRGIFKEYKKYDKTTGTT